MRFHLTPLLILAISGTTTTSVSAFGIPAKHQAFSRITKSVSRLTIGPLLAKPDDDEVSKGMEDAFRELDEMKSLGDDPFTVPEKKKTQDEAFAKAMKALDLKDIIEVAAPSSPESEAELYKNMASEIDGKTDEDLIAGVKTVLGGSAAMFPKFDPTMRDTDKFMEKALDEALEEAEKQADIDKESILDNKEIMGEIEKIFDKANVELLEELEEMRAEQMTLVKESAERNSAKRIEEDQQRLAMADGNMRKMLARVNKETQSVESAINELKQAQEDSEGGVETQLSGLKSGGIVKQTTLVGTLLFSFRSAVEGVAYFGGDASHLLPAIVQAAIAVVCLVAFLFL